MSVRCLTMKLGPSSQRSGQKALAGMERCCWYASAAPLHQSPRQLQRNENVGYTTSRGMMRTKEQKSLLEYEYQLLKNSRL
jgi:hypothetical protein